MATLSTIVSPRRMYLLKSQAARLVSNTGLELIWRGKQLAEPGTNLPDDFPSKSALATAYYTTVEDLTGAGTQELVTEARLSTKQADTVIAAVAAL